MDVSGTTGRYAYTHATNDDFEQPRALFRNVMDDSSRTNLINTIAGTLGNARKCVITR